MNEQITNYLEYYVKLDNPQYAVLLAGKWGCGKTYYGKNLLEKWKKSEDSGTDSIILKPIYISLNGIGNISIITEKIKAEISPFLYSKGAKMAKSALQGLLKASIRIDMNWDKDDDNGGSIMFNPDLLDLFSTKDEKIKGKKILVFDDIERCKIKTEELFGYINIFVEHSGCKVILLADEEKIINNDNKYKIIKEKLIGQTFEVKSEIDTAVDSFIKESCQVNNQLELKLCKELIIDLFNASQSENLRILRQALLDFYRLTTFIEDKFVKHNRYEEFIKNLLTYFLIVYMEYKSGNEKINKFQNTLNAYLSKEKEDSEGKKLEMKYNLMLNKHLIYNSMYILSIDTILNFIKSGNISIPEFNQILETCTFFATDKRQDWEKLWRWEELNDKLFIEIRKKVWKQFHEEKIDQPLAVVHISGILISLIDNNLFNKNKTYVVKRAKQILNRICDTYMINHNLYGILANAREYHAESSSELKEILDYLYKKCNKARDNIRDSYLKNIFDGLTDGAVIELYRKLNETLPDYSTTYEYYSIFKPIDGKKIGEKIKIFSSKSIYEFNHFIHHRYYPEERYSNGKLEPYHKDDMQCLVNMKEELCKGLKKREPIKSKVISRLIEELEKTIDKLNNLEV